MNAPLRIANSFLVKDLKLDLLSCERELKAEIHFNYYGPEPRSAYAPGYPAEAEILSIQVNGYELLPMLPGEYVKDLQREIAEGA